METFTDQLNRKISLPQIPTRIVSLVPSQTELLVDLGLEDSIVGITKFCVHPENLRKNKNIVGGTKSVHYDSIKGLRPDIILCNKEENTKEMVAELEKIAPVHVSDIFTINDALDLIHQYGNIFQTQKTAGGIIAKIEKEFIDFQKYIRDKPIRKAGYFIWKRPWMVVGKDTFINHLLEVNHFENVFSEDGTRYPKIELEEIITKKPELILLSSEPFPFQRKHKEALQREIKGIQIEIVDGEMFSWYGSRLIKAFQYFKTLHEE